MAELGEKIERFIATENDTTMKLALQAKKGITCTAMRLRTAWADYVYEMIVFAIENNMPLEVAALLTPIDLNGGKS